MSNANAVTTILNPTPNRKARPRKSLAERFAAAPKQRDPATGCLHWLGAKNGGQTGNGYGEIKGEDGRVLRANRVAWALEHGPIPVGRMILHSCHNRSCVELTHLRCGTHAENMADMMQAGRQPVYTGRKLDDPAIVSLVGFRDWGGWTQQAAADEMGISVGTVGRYWRGQAGTEAIEREHGRWDDEAEAEMRAAAKPA